MKNIIHIDDSDFLELERDGTQKVIFLDIDGVLNQDNGGPKMFCEASGAHCGRDWCRNRSVLFMARCLCESCRPGT